ncbi:MAG: ferritin-like domain-containing protein [Gemmatirosa sp.]
MESQHILEQIEPRTWDRLVSRRDAVRKGMLAGLAAGSLPMILGALSRTAYAQAPTSVLAVLNFALTLEYLEAEFYNIATGTTAIPAAYGTSASVLSASGAPVRAVITQIAAHETAHVNLLRTTITSLGGTPVVKPTFDFTAGRGATNTAGRFTGPFADVFTNPQTFLALAQAFEDTGVRAYKGGVGALASNVAVLEAALQIHSIEARHASMVRRIRGEKGWITGRTNTLPAAAQPVYGPGSSADFPAEDNTTHAGVNVATLAGVAGANAATEGFDEPLDVATVNSIAALFIRP